MTAIDTLIKADHDRVKSFFLTLKHAPASSQPTIVTQMIDLVTRHLAAEEAVLYPLFPAKLPDGAAFAAHCTAVHAVITANFNLLKQSDAIGFTASLVRAYKSFEEHAKELEAIELPFIVKACDQAELERIGAEFEAHKAPPPVFHMAADGSERSRINIGRRTFAEKVRRPTPVQTARAIPAHLLPPTPAPTTAPPQPLSSETAPVIVPAPVKDTAPTPVKKSITEANTFAEALSLYKSGAKSGCGCPS